YQPATRGGAEDLGGVAAGGEFSAERDDGDSTCDTAKTSSMDGLDGLPGALAPGAHTRRNFLHFATDQSCYF
ncbi:hypothetical protein, partial [Cupriavidus plantarum]|uniref:hypothetical protein n=1 Tax=Cupriavidus plantarum TaxID=942865 RepID=UPI00339D9B50